MNPPPQFAGHLGPAPPPTTWRRKQTKELVAMKYVERCRKIDENVAREIINHRSLRHPNIIRFKELLLTPSRLGIVMEYAAGGELFDRICTAGRFSEDEARYFFRWLISGVSFCHTMVLTELKPCVELAEKLGRLAHVDLFTRGLNILGFDLKHVRL